MKVLQVAHGFPPYQTGGTENCTYLLSKQLAGKHNEEVFVFSGGLPHDYSYPYKDEKIEGVSVRRVHSLPFSILRQRIPGVGLPTYKNRIIENLFRDYLEKICPDVIHFQHTIGLSTSLIDMAIEYEMSTIATIRDFWYVCPRIQLLRHDGTICGGPDRGLNCAFCTGRSVRKDDDSFRSSKTERVLSKAMPEKIKKIIRRRKGEMRHSRSMSMSKDLLPFIIRYNYVTETLKRANTIISPSKYLKEMHTVIANINPEKITVLPHGIIQFNAKSRRVPKSPIRFGFCGFPSRHKGAYLLLDVFSKIPEDRGKLIIWGKGWNEISSELRSKSYVELKGPYYPKDLGSVYSSFDVLIIPSIWGETFSFVAHEAFFARVPVIASRYGVFKEIIKEGKNGLLFDVGSRDSLFEKVMEIVDHPELIEKFEKNIIPPKTWAQYSDELMEIYKKVIKG